MDLLSKPLSSGDPQALFLGIMPIKDKVFEDFYLDFFEPKSIQFWLLDFIYNTNFESNDHRKELKFVSENDFVCALESVPKHTIIILNIGLNSRTIKIYQIIRYLGLNNVVYFSRGALPKNTQILNRKISSDLIIRFLNRVLLDAKAYLNYFFRPPCTFKYEFRAGFCGNQAIGPLSNILPTSDNIIPINYFDVDNYKESVKHEHPRKYLVFLDECLPYHPDFLFSKTRTIDPEIYYNELKGTLRFLGKILECDVIIASHPKSDDRLQSKYFKGFEVRKGITANLVAGSELCVFHVSSSVSYAVLSNKPVISLVSNDIKEVMPGYYNWISAFASELGSDIVNMSTYELEFTTTHSVKQLLKYDCNRYADYVSNYLSTNIRMNTQEIVYEHYSKLLG